MNSLERIIATIGYQTTDQVPVLPVLLLQGAKLLHTPLPLYLQNPNAIAQGQQALVEKYGHDGVFGVPCFITDILAFGGTIAYAAEGSPCVGKLAWRNWSDLEHVKLLQPKQYPALANVLKTIELLAAKYKGKKLIVGSAVGPFSLPSILIGTEKWMELLWEDDILRGPIMRQCLEICKDFCVIWAREQLQAGADIVVLVDGIASATCITREQFEQMALPYIQKTIAEIDGLVGYEPLGRIEPFIDLLPNIGCKVLMLECHDDLAQCKKVVMPHTSIMGNLNNIEMIHWTQEQAQQACIQALNQGYPGNGFILSNQAEIPWDTPDHIISCIIQTAKSWPIQ